MTLLVFLLTYAETLRIRFLIQNGRIFSMRNSQRIFHNGQTSSLSDYVCRYTQTSRGHIPKNVRACAECAVESPVHSVAGEDILSFEKKNRACVRARVCVCVHLFRFCVDIATFLLRHARVGGGGEGEVSRFDVALYVYCLRQIYVRTYDRIDNQSRGYDIRC